MSPSHKDMVIVRSSFNQLNSKSNPWIPKLLNLWKIFNSDQPIVKFKLHRFCGSCDVLDFDSWNVKLKGKQRICGVMHGLVVGEYGLMDQNFKDNQIWNLGYMYSISASPCMWSSLQRGKYSNTLFSFWIYLNSFEHKRWNPKRSEVLDCLYWDIPRQ